MQKGKRCQLANYQLRCPCWNISASDYFHLVTTLPGSGITIYITGTQHKHDQTSASKLDYAMVIDNSNGSEFLAVNVINELGNYKTSCPRCLNVVKRAQAILNYYNCVKEDNILGICSHCSEARRKKLSCDSCDNLTEKFRTWKRRYLEGVVEPKDSKVWLRRIDQALQEIKEPGSTKKQQDRDKNLKTSKDIDVILDAKTSKAQSYTDRDLNYDQKVKGVRAVSYENLAPAYGISTDAKTDFDRKKKHNRQAVSDSALKEHKREAKKKDEYSAVETSKSRALLKTKTKTLNDQDTTSSGSDVNEHKKNKIPIKNEKKILPLSNSKQKVKSSALGPRSSMDLELVKHRKLRKHHSLDTLLTSLYKKQKKNRKNFVYLFPEELKPKSKSSVTLKPAGKNKLKAKTDEGDEKRNLFHHIPQDDLLPDRKKNQKSKSKLQKKEMINYKSDSEYEHNDRKSGRKEIQVKQLSARGENNTKDKEKGYRMKNNKLDKFEADNTANKREAKLGNSSKDKRKKVDGYGGKGVDINEFKIDLDTKVTKGNKGLVNLRKKHDKNVDKSEQLVKDNGVAKSGKDKDYKTAKHGKGVDDNKHKIDQSTGVDLSRKDKGKNGSKEKRGSKLYKNRKGVNENEPEHDQRTQLVNRGKDKHGKGVKEINKLTLDQMTSKLKRDKIDSAQVRGSKATKHGINEDIFESKLGATSAKRGKGDINDFGAKQDHSGGGGKRSKGESKYNDKENSQRGQLKSDGDKLKKRTKGKNTAYHEGKEKQTSGKSGFKRHVTGESHDKAHGDGEFGHSLQKGVTGKLKDGTTKAGHVAGKAQVKPGYSVLLLKQIHAQRSVLDNKIDGLVKIKGIVDNKHPVIENYDVDLVLEKIKKEPKIEADDDQILGEVQCEQKSGSVHEFIVGEIITKVKPVYIEERDIGEQPILFSTKLDQDEVQETKANEITEDIPRSPAVDKEETTGITHYALSDRQFIDMGWTMLPTEKVVRKMNVYRMRPAHPEFNWFERNKNKKNIFYDSGERMAELDENSRGKWFYKNGRLALDYYEAEEVNAQQRFVIYSSGENDCRGRPRPVAVLAVFDYLGNGLVLDNAGKTRLKYNQTEGVILDKSLGPVSHWKWHTLNDPPVLQQVMMDTQLAHKDQDILLMDVKGENAPRPDNEDMLAIEFDNFIKEKSKKLAQTFKPFQIKMKALKINEYFSLRILDQASVYLIFRDGTTNIKLNIGMILDHKEIVDTDTAELGDVSNSIERFPARTGSLEGIQRSVAHAQCVEATRVGLERRRLQPPVPVASADRLAATISKPLRPRLRVAPTTNCCPNLARNKNTCSNLYYETRII